MIRVLGILVVVGVLVGCGEEIKIHTEKYDNGKVKIKGNLVDGKQEGKWVWYYEDGQISREENYKDGERDGKWVEYDEEGNITSERCYEMGEEVDCP